jgi:hypothetical protein
MIYRSEGPVWVGVIGVPTLWNMCGLKL